MKCFREHPAVTVDEYKLIAATRELDPKETRGYWNVTRKRYIAHSGALGLEEAMDLS